MIGIGLAASICWATIFLASLLLHEEASTSSILADVSWSNGVRYTIHLDGSSVITLQKNGMVIGAIEAHDWTVSSARFSDDRRYVVSVDVAGVQRQTALEEFERVSALLSTPAISKLSRAARQWVLAIVNVRSNKAGERTSAGDALVETPVSPESAL